MVSCAMHRARSLLVLATLVAVAVAATAQPAKPKLVTGTVGLTAKEVPLRNACTKTFSQIKKTKRGDDPALVAALTYPRITGLDFDPKNERRAAASKKKFEDWFVKLTKTVEVVTTAQRAAFLDDKAATPQVRAESAARLSIVLDQAALIIESSEIPVNIRTITEASEVYCDMLFEKTEPLRAQAKLARESCGHLAGTAKLTEGWFLAVCTPPTAAAAPATQPTTPVAPARP